MLQKSGRNIWPSLSKTKNKIRKWPLEIVKDKEARIMPCERIWCLCVKHNHVPMCCFFFFSTGKEESLSRYLCGTTGQNGKWRKEFRRGIRIMNAALLSVACTFSHPLPPECHITKSGCPHMHRRVRYICTRKKFWHIDARLWSSYNTVLFRVLVYMSI